MQQPANRLARTIQKIEQVAGPFRQRAVTLALGRTVKFVGTVRLNVEELTAERAVVSFENKKRATGVIRAEAWLSDEQRKAIAAEPKGEVVVQCRVTDESGIEPIRCEMIWAWVPKKRT